MKCSRLRLLALAVAMVLGASVARAQEAAAPAPKKTVKLLSVGNSFSGNASAYIRQMAEAGGNELIYTNAYIGGCPLDKHIYLALKHEFNQTDPAGIPYPIKGADGKETRASLKDLLLKEKWEFVTIQQSSINSFKAETYRPYAQDLVNYIHTYAPQAKIVVHETWAYRADDGIFKDGFTDIKMYQDLHKNYAATAKEVGAAGILPVGTAFMNALQDPQWKFAMPAHFNPKEAKPTEKLMQEHSLHAGYSWDTKKEPAKLNYDGHHANNAGQYLGGAVWYEFFFGDVRGNKFVPKGMTQEDVTFLQNVAHKTVADGVKPAFAETK